MDVYKWWLEGRWVDMAIWVVMYEWAIGGWMFYKEVGAENDFVCSS